MILRVDSPGGDGIAGDMISREVELTSKEKPVVVSMSDVAASGGYEIAYRADRIIAMPASITGSIGSITGKMNVRGLYNKLGVTKDEIGTGKNSLIYSDYRDFSDDEWALVREEHWAFYRSWIEEIARFREMPVDSIDSLGRGRVWTGTQAVATGLIDGMGGMRSAVSAACELAGIADSSRVVLVHYPQRVDHPAGDPLAESPRGRRFIRDSSGALRRSRGAGRALSQACRRRSDPLSGS